MFQEYLVQDIVLSVSMWLFLGLGAWFDAHGTEVPDALSVPYVILGVTASLLHGRIGTAIIVMAVLIFILQPYRPRFLRKLNEWLVKRAYKGDDEKLEADTAKESMEAKAFQEKQGNRMDVIVSALYVIIPIALATAAFVDGWSAASVISTLIAISGFAVYMQYLMQAAKVAEEQQGEESHDLPISAFGGADALIFDGMLGFYGVIPWVFGMGVTLCGYLLMLAIKRIVTRKEIIGAAMLPAMFAFAPARLLIAVTICTPILEAYQWLLS